MALKLSFTTSKAPAKPTEGSKAAEKGGEDEKNITRFCKEMHSSYLYQVLKQVNVTHPDTPLLTIF
jgi:hypothetical protein